MRRKKLPAPRLEFEWTPDTPTSWESSTCTYRLVLPLREFDIRRENKNGRKVRSEFKVELGKTRVQSSRNGDWSYPLPNYPQPYRNIV